MSLEGTGEGSLTILQGGVHKGSTQEAIGPAFIPPILKHP